MSYEVFLKKKTGFEEYLAEDKFLLQYNVNTSNIR